jgi:hypothetical protein
MHSVLPATFQGLRAKRQIKTSARNNLAIYDEVAADWWLNKIR